MNRAAAWGETSRKAENSTGAVGVGAPLVCLGGSAGGAGRRCLGFLPRALGIPNPGDGFGFAASWGAQGCALSALVHAVQGHGTVAAHPEPILGFFDFCCAFYPSSVFVMWYKCNHSKSIQTDFAAILVFSSEKTGNHYSF